MDFNFLSLRRSFGMVSATHSQAFGEGADLIITEDRVGRIGTGLNIKGSFRAVGVGWGGGCFELGGCRRF